MYPVAQHEPLPWWLFQLLIFLPCFYAVYPLMLEKCIVWTGNSAKLARRRAFKQARKKIEQCIARGDSTKLYAIFMELFQQVEIHIEGAEWHGFFERIAYAAYAHGDDNNSELCRIAKQWLERLEKIL